jgi:hypothetical protein
VRTSYFFHTPYLDVAIRNKAEWVVAITEAEGGYWFFETQEEANGWLDASGCSYRSIALSGGCHLWVLDEGEDWTDELEEDVYGAVIPEEDS